MTGFLEPEGADEDGDGHRGGAVHALSLQKN